MPYDPKLNMPTMEALAGPFEALKDLGDRIGQLGIIAGIQADAFRAKGKDTQANVAELFCDHIVTIGFAVSRAQVGPFPTPEATDGQA